MARYIDITVVEFCDSKEELLLDLYFESRYEDERYDILKKLVKIGGCRALGVIALSGMYEDERKCAMKGLGRLGGRSGACVLAEVAKESRYEDERQLARDMLVGC